MSKRSIDEEDANEAVEKKLRPESEEEDEEEGDVKDAQDYLVSVWNDPENEGEIRDALIDLLYALEYAGERGDLNWASAHCEDPDLELVDSEIEKFLVPLLGSDCATRIKWLCDIDDTIWYPGAIQELLEEEVPWRRDIMSMSIGLKEDFTSEEAENHMLTCVYPHCANKQDEADLKAWFETMIWF